MRRPIFLPMRRNRNKNAMHNTMSVTSSKIRIVLTSISDLYIYVFALLIPFIALIICAPLVVSRLSFPLSLFFLGLFCFIRLLHFFLQQSFLCPQLDVKIFLLHFRMLLLQLLNFFRLLQLS